METTNIQQTLAKEKTIAGADARTPAMGKPYRERWLEAMVKGFGTSASISTANPLLRVTGLNDAESIVKSYFYINSLAARETRAEYQLALRVAVEALLYLYSKGGIDFIDDPKKEAQEELTNAVEPKDFKGFWDDFKDDPSALTEATASKGDGSWWNYHADIFREQIEIRRIREERGLSRPFYLDEEVQS